MQRAEAEDAITESNIDLQEPSNRRTKINSVETVQPDPDAVDRGAGKKKLKKKKRKSQKISFSPCQSWSYSSDSGNKEEHYVIHKN